jgi:hypothetical protein
MGSPTTDGLSEVAWGNWYAKHRFALCRRYLGILTGYRPSDAEAREAVSKAQAQLRHDLNEDATYWQGWWGRRDYTLNFLGDDVAGTSAWRAVVPQAVLVVLFLVLMGALVRETRPKPPPRVPQRVPAAVHANDEKVYHAPQPIQKVRARHRQPAARNLAPERSGRGRRHLHGLCRSVTLCPRPHASRPQ